MKNVCDELRAFIESQHCGDVSSDSIVRKLVEHFGAINNCCKELSLVRKQISEIHKVVAKCKANQNEKDAKLEGQKIQGFKDRRDELLAMENALNAATKDILKSLESAVAFEVKSQKASHERAILTLKSEFAVVAQSAAKWMRDYLEKMQTFSAMKLSIRDKVTLEELFELAHQQLQSIPMGLLSDNHEQVVAEVNPLVMDRGESEFEFRRRAESLWLLKSSDRGIPVGVISAIERNAEASIDVKLTAAVAEYLKNRKLS